MAKDTIDNHKVIVIGGSAGSLTIALKLLPALRPSNLSVIIVFHRKQTDDTVLVDILSTRTQFQVREIEDKDILRPQVIYVAPADYHVLVEKDLSLTLDYSEKVNYSRPSIDVTFESAAQACGDRLSCILLSGANADGADGLLIAKSLGARIIIQDPSSAEVPFMPQSALDRVVPDILINESNFHDVFSSL
jgi:two-component system, chemotaxis family, protein-glutamate methylesterase/glutaminase